MVLKSLFSSIQKRDVYTFFVYFQANEIENINLLLIDRFSILTFLFQIHD